MGDKIITAQIALDNINTILEDEDAKNVLGVKNSTVIVQVKSSRLLALNLIKSAEEKVAQAKAASDEDSVILAGEEVKRLLTLTGQTLDQTYTLLEASIVSYDFSQTKLDSFKATVSAQIIR